MPIEFSKTAKEQKLAALREQLENDSPFNSEAEIDVDDTKKKGRKDFLMEESKDSMQETSIGTTHLPPLTIDHLIS